MRDKRLPVDELLGRGRRAVMLARTRGAGDAIVVVNDRADVAAAVGAAGVHVPEHTLGQPAESYGGGLKGVNRRKLPLQPNTIR